ncbi:hypothetical protein COEREDRAFT_99914 [Coemansia reversa NRRL 1564]|uniref:Uncharacterized protein n=1 Tax=Coemansia reversa (strain ATCC 12441 / NRRL 1564) TaxID=763665 RepID=A0A2G5B1I6_COERN|nr:hypothetical protein COEREDRAFT_99914 [Coemansia reversa NRRL 1564]|eukprot:PIA12873.1 hypothetical protein COEREDRAFT_99914 [Coemansia reversa NRRL 1564]
MAELIKSLFFLKVFCQLFYSAAALKATAVTVEDSTLSPLAQHATNSPVIFTTTTDFTITETIHASSYIEENENANLVVIGKNIPQTNFATDTIIVTQYYNHVIPGPTVTSYIYKTLNEIAYPPPNIMVVPVTNAIPRTKTVTEHVTPSIIFTPMAISMQIPMTATATFTAVSTEFGASTIISTVTETPSSPEPTEDKPEPTTNKKSLETSSKSSENKADITEAVKKMWKKLDEYEKSKKLESEKKTTKKPPPSKPTDYPKSSEHPKPTETEKPPKPPCNGMMKMFAGAC